MSFRAGLKKIILRESLPENMFSDWLKQKFWRLEINIRIVGSLQQIPSSMLIIPYWGNRRVEKRLERCFVVSAERDTGVGLDFQSTTSGKGRGMEGPYTRLQCV